MEASDDASSAAVDAEAALRVSEVLERQEINQPSENSPDVHHADVTDDDFDISRLYGNAMLFGHDAMSRIIALWFEEPNSSRDIFGRTTAIPSRQGPDLSRLYGARGRTAFSIPNSFMAGCR